MTDDYESKSNEIRQLASLAPDQMTDHLSNLHNTLDGVAPNIAPHIHSTAVNAIQFLNSKLPHSGNELPQDRIPEPSSAQRRAWLDLHEAVSDPVSVLEHVKNQTLNRHHVEALQSVYPDLHQEMIQRMQDHIGQMKLEGKQIPYQKRIAISKFMGMPLDSTLTQPTMQAIINSASQNAGPEAQAAGKGPQKASGPELNQINKVNSIYQTRSQAREINRNK